MTYKIARRVKLRGAPYMLAYSLLVLIRGRLVRIGIYSSEFGSQSKSSRLYSFLFKWNRKINMLNFLRTNICPNSSGFYSQHEIKRITLTASTRLLWTEVLLYIFHSQKTENISKTICVWRTSTGLFFDRRQPLGFSQKAICISSLYVQRSCEDWKQSTGLLQIKIPSKFSHTFHRTFVNSKPSTGLLYIK